MFVVQYTSCGSYIIVHILVGFTSVLGLLDYILKQRLYQVVIVTLTKTETRHVSPPLVISACDPFNTCMRAAHGIVQHTIVPTSTTEVRLAFFVCSATSTLDSLALALSTPRSFETVNASRSSAISIRLYAEAGAPRTKPFLVIRLIHRCILYKRKIPSNTFQPRLHQQLQSIPYSNFAAYGAFGKKATTLVVFV